MRPIDLIERARARGRQALDEADGKRLLAAFGAAVPAFAVAGGPDEAGQAVRESSGPFAVKVMSQDILHKSDAGGVVLGAVDASAVRRAIETIAAQPKVRSSRVDGYLVEQMCVPGIELVIGAVRDPQFGPMLMVGLGGIFVEVLRDVAFRLCPIDREDAHAMLAELRGSPMLDGIRGRAGIDREVVVDLLLRIGGADGLMAALDGEIAELDLNPVIVSGSRAVVADARVILTDRSPDPGESRRSPSDPDLLAGFRPLFEPRTIAVLGASATGTTIANTFLRRLKETGFAGRVYPVHPSADEIEGLRCVRSLASAPEPIDYAYVAVGARSIPALLRDAGGQVRFAQVISSGFGEVADGAALEAELVAAARAGGCRILGPNCLGLYSPRGRVSFASGAPAEIGTVGVVSQSGGLGTDIIKRGRWRGLRFSGLVTVGNSADIGPVDLLEYYFADPGTRVVGLYLEDIKDGRRFFDLLRSAAASKPVVILRGGRSEQGRAAAVSHTGAMAGDGRVWDALSKQTGCVLVRTVDEFIDALLAFQCLVPRPQSPTRRVVLFGNGGGTGVLATDAFAERGLDVAPLPATAIERLEALRMPPGTSVVNPIDTPVATMQAEEGRIAGRILDIVYDCAPPDALVMHINLSSFVGRAGADPVDNLIAALVAARGVHAGITHVVLVLRADGSPELEERRRRYRESAVAAGIPVYDELEPVAGALAAVGRAEAYLRAVQRAAGAG